MNTVQRPAFLVAGTHSGCGKTTLTVGLMAALRRRGLAVAPLKCGPDFIDPTLHRLAAGAVSRNLDLWMMGEDAVRATFHRHAAAADVAVVEGVMGLFDGGEGSGAALARFLGLPVVLVIDARSMAESVAALVKGFAELDPCLRLAGVICNRTASDRHRQLLATAIAEHCRAPLLGCIGRDEAVAIPSRHLGLHMAEDAPLSAAGLDRLADLVEGAVDLDRLLADCRVEIAAAEPRPLADVHPGVRIAVARDAAFCFYYQDNLERLAAAGAELLPFSPLADAALPDGTLGVYLGGGYPELHAPRLAGNVSMREALRQWSRSGGLVYAECGGFMYLCEGIEIEAGFLPMAGVFPTRARMRKGRTALGYREVELAAGCCLGEKGTRLRGHEFHYSDIGPMPKEVERLYRLPDGGMEGYRIGNTLGSYLHLHFASRPEAAASLVRAASGTRGRVAKPAPSRGT